MDEFLFYLIHMYFILTLHVNKEYETTAYFLILIINDIDICSCFHIIITIFLPLLLDNYL